MTREDSAAAERRLFDHYGLAAERRSQPRPAVRSLDDPERCAALIRQATA